MPEINIFLIRHCHVAYYTDLGEKYCLPKLQNHLTPLGWAQALELDYLLNQSQINFDKIFTSHLARTVETITPFAIRNNLEINKIPELGEVITGSSYKEWEQMAKTSPDFNFPNGESYNQAINRFGNAINQILDSYKEVNNNLNFIIVSHGAILESWLGSIFENLEIKMTWPDVYKLKYQNNSFLELIKCHDLIPSNISFHSELSIYPTISM